MLLQNATVAGVVLTPPDQICAVVVLAAAAWCLLASWVTKTHSHVDRLWSITPVVYVLVYALYDVVANGAKALDARLALMATLVLLWGARLSYNFARKGGYSAGEQDYRWPVLQKLPVLRHPIAWQLFNLSFIASYQNVLLFLIAAPTSYVYRAATVALPSRRVTRPPLTALDLIATCLFQSFWILESVADQQQWEFQQSKHRARGHPRIAALEEDYRRGFLTSGLFRLSRHPNFFAEQALWCSFYLFSVAASCQSPTEVAALFRAPVDWRAWVNWSATGAALLVALFQGSTPFTESITRGKYASYAAYQKTTSRLVPWFPARGKQISSTGAAATGTVITATGERKSTRARKPRKLED
jgi:steroid 5-alpha reductase family enzyme